MKIAGERIIARIRSQVFNSIMKKDVRFFDETRSGELVSRLASDSVVVGKVISE